jgi:hypothetical protein
MKLKLLYSYEISFVFSSVGEVRVAAVLQLTETVNQTGIEIEIEIVFPVGETVSTLDPDVGLNLLYVIQHGTKIQVNCFPFSIHGKINYKQTLKQAVL